MARFSSNLTIDTERCKIRHGTRLWNIQYSVRHRTRVHGAANVHLHHRHDRRMAQSRRAHRDRVHTCSLVRTSTLEASLMRQHGSIIDNPCTDPRHANSEGIQINQHNEKCPTCTSIAQSGEHDHLHTEAPYKAGCGRCSTEREVRCKCGQHH